MSSECMLISARYAQLQMLPSPQAHNGRDRSYQLRVPNSDHQDVCRSAHIRQELIQRLDGHRCWRRSVSQCVIDLECTLPTPCQRVTHLDWTQQLVSDSQPCRPAGL